MIANVPDASTEIPTVVGRLAGDEPVRAVWRNEAGGLTFAVGDPLTRYIKWSPKSAHIDLAAEATRLRWARGLIVVPDVLDTGDTDDGTGYLVTRAVRAESAVSPRWLGDPAKAVAAIGAGLRRLHDALPVGDCPFSWSIADRLRQSGIDPATAQRQPPDIDRLVVCHGDACAPNTLIGDDGQPVAHVDLGSLGVADRWADIAVATYSSIWNYGPGWERTLLEAYGIEPDRKRTSYYRWLWDLDERFS